MGIVVATLTALVLAGCGSSSESDSPAATVSPPTAGATSPGTDSAFSAADEETAEELSEEFFSLLQRGDTAGLDAFLDPAFQIVRADGTTADKSQYVGQPPTVLAFQIDDMVASRDGNLLVARYEVSTEEVIDEQVITSSPAPRMSVFIDDNGTWRLLAHANLTGDSADTPLAAASPLSDPASPEDAAIAERVQNEFFTALQNGDSTALAALLSPAFQLVRADGSSANREQYLADPATMNSFELSDFAVTSTGDVLVARFMGSTSEVIDGVEYSRAAAPRFAVMKRDGDTWKIVGQVNFNAPAN